MGRSPSFPRLAGSGHNVLHSLGSAVESTLRRTTIDDARRGRHLLYGSSATSNQRLIIQRGNCATSVYDRASRHARWAGDDAVFAEDVRRGWAEPS